MVPTLKLISYSTKKKMKVKDITTYLENIAPPMYQESYDNSGLIVGNPNAKIKGILICLDSIEQIVDEAIERDCNMIIAHHPIVFKGLKRFNGKNYVERAVIKAIKHDISIYAIHTNLDNVRAGVNGKIASKLGLQKTRILAPKRVMKKLIAIVPVTHVDIIKNNLFGIGAGLAGESIQSSYTSLGAMSQGNNTQPMAKLELTFSKEQQSAVTQILQSIMGKESYSYDIIDVHSKQTEIGSGIIGQLKKETDVMKFLTSLKKTMNVGCVKYTAIENKKIKNVAICGGSGGFLLKDAIRQKADIFITSDYKYHEFFDADGQIIIADIGHFESEQYTIDLIYDLLKDKFSTFAILKTNINTNPVNYL